VVRVNARVAAWALTGVSLAGSGLQWSAACQAPQHTMVAVQDVAWSLSGQRLFFSAMRVKPDYSDYSPDKWAVYVYDHSASATRLVAGAAFSVTAGPADGQIVVGRMVDGNRDLYLLDESGRELARLTTDPAEDFAPAFSPDGQLLAFTSKRNGHAEVFVARADGSDPRRLVDAAQDRTYNPSWSPDGRHIAFYRESGDGADQIWVARPDGTGERNLTQDTYNNIFPGWTPDGRVLYGQGQRDRATLAFTVRIDGTSKEPLFGIEAFFVRYSSDGSRIAYLQDHPDGVGVRIILADRDGRTAAVVPLDEVGVGTER